MTSHCLDLPQQHTCQCCLGSSKNNNFKDLTTEYHYLGKSEKYTEMIYNVFCLTINSNNNSICEDCIQKLRDAADFKQLVVETQRILLKRADDSLCKDNKVVEVKCEVDLDLSTENDTNITDYNSDDVQVDVKTEQPCTVMRKKKNVILKPKRELRPSRAPSCSLEAKQETKPLEIVLVKKENLANVNRNGFKKKKIKQESEKLTSNKRNEAHMKNTTITLVSHSNLTLFDWNKNQYRCFCCKELFLDAILLKEHVKSHSLDVIKEKLNRFNSKYYYRAEVTDLKCAECQKNVENLNELIVHLTQDHNIAFDTNESHLMPFRLKRHACQLCSLEFKTFVPLDHHMTSHFSKYICDACGKGFRHKNALQTHIANIHKKRLYKCKMCQLGFETYYKKRKHDLTVHKLQFDNVCPHCPQKFGNYIARMLHLVKEHGYIKPDHKCDHCHKGYITKALLNSHVRKVHMLERNFECEICKNKYMRKCELTDHMKSHIQARDFVCSYCGKGFFRRKNLNGHLAIHVAEYRHECSLCGKTFAQKYNMNMHKKRCQGGQ